MENVYPLNINYKFDCQIINFCVISVSINHLLKTEAVSLQSNF